jgi:hypothetical protein
MFSLGIGEALRVGKLVLARHTIVWLGGAEGEDGSGLPSSHPVCRVLRALAKQQQESASWVLCRDAREMRSFELKSLEIQLAKTGWSVDRSLPAVIRAERAALEPSFWPASSEPVLSRSGFEILVIGSARAGQFDCANADRTAHAVLGDSIAVASPIVESIAADRCLVASLGRTHTENSPGVSIIAAAGRAVDVPSLVEFAPVFATHVGDDAQRAWSYPRCRAS